MFWKGAGINKVYTILPSAASDVYKRQDAGVAVLRGGEGQRCHGVKQPDQMLHLVAGGQACDIYFHALFRLCVPERLPDIEVIVQLLSLIHI